MNKQSYDIKVATSDCSVSVISLSGTKTIRAENDNPETPFVLVMSLPSSSDEQIHRQYANAKVTVTIETVEDVKINN